MNWEAVSALGTFLGAIGVIASLLYLALQIRQYNRGMRVSTYYETANQITTTMMGIAQSDDLSDIWNRGMDEFDQFTSGQKSRFEMMMICYFHQNEAQFFAHHHGFGDKAVWEAKAREFAIYLGRPGVHRVWDDYHTMLSTEFVEQVNGIIKRNTTAA